MTYNELSQEIFRLQSFLCVGLDSDITKIPRHLLQKENPVLAFNQAIIEATQEYCVAYKINTAFYEAQGLAGWETLEATVQSIPQNKLIIADAKRGDIGNTGKMYAQAFFDQMSVDALTLAPYMGQDSIQAFLDYPNKWSILLALTSNEGSRDFQMLRLKNGSLLYEEVLERSSKWGSFENMMYVVGATQTSFLHKIRQIIPKHFLLVPGVGAQGGDLEEVIRLGRNEAGGLLINSSRGIIYASADEEYADAAREAAQALQKQMAIFF